LSERWEDVSETMLLFAASAMSTYVIPNIAVN